LESESLSLDFSRNQKEEYLHELDGCCCDSISNPFGSFRCVVVGICSPLSPAAIHMSNAVVNAVGHGFTYDIEKITKNYSADCISWNPTKHKEGGDDGSCTVQKGMSQEINLTEIIHELPGKGMGMYLFRTGRR